MPDCLSLPCFGNKLSFDFDLDFKLALYWLLAAMINFLYNEVTFEDSTLRITFWMKVNFDLIVIDGRQRFHPLRLVDHDSVVFAGHQTNFVEYLVGSDLYLNAVSVAQNSHADSPW